MTKDESMKEESMTVQDTAAGDGPGAMVGVPAEPPGDRMGNAPVAGNGQHAPGDPAAPLPEAEVAAVSDAIVAALKTVYDPEIPCDIYELGLIYKVDLDEDRNVAIEMTLTAPGCPVAGEMPAWVENAVRAVPGVGDVTVKLVFDPPWDPSRMSDEARLALNMFY